MNSDLKTPLVTESDDEGGAQDKGHSVLGTPRPVAQRCREEDDALACKEMKTADTATDQPKGPTLTLSYSVTRARWVSTVGLLLFAMGSYPSQSVLSQYLVHRWSQEENISDVFGGNLCFRNGTDPRQKQEDEIQARVSTTVMFLSYTVSLPAVVSSLVAGVYCDVVGRRKILMLPVAATLIKFLANIFIVRYNLDVNYLYFGFALEGICGSYFVVLIASFSITADLSAHKSSRVIWINIMICLNQSSTGGFQIVLGFIIDHLGFLAAFIIITVPLGVSFFLILFFLPETRPRADDSTSNVLANAKRLIRMYTSEGSRRYRITLYLCLVLFFISLIDILNVNSIDTLYQMNRPLCWDATQLGYYSSLSQSGLSVAGLIYLSIVQRCGCVSDEVVAMVGMLFQGSGYVLEAFVKYDWMMYMVPVLRFPSFPTVGIIQGIISLLAGPYNQGAVFASIAVVESICSFASNTALYQVYTATVNTFAGAVYLVMAGFCFLNFFLFFVFLHFYEDPSKSENKNLTVQRDSEKTFDESISPKE